jgi:hypothetical protein
MNISATSGSVRKFTKIDHVAKGAIKNNSVEVIIIMAKNATQATVTLWA